MAEPKKTPLPKKPSAPKAATVDIEAEVDAKLSKAASLKKNSYLDGDRLFQDLGIGPQNQPALALSFNNILSKIPGSRKVTSPEVTACKTRGDCVKLVKKAAKGQA